MALIKREPFDEIDRFFRDLAPHGGSARGAQMGFDMAVDVYEDGNAIIAEMNAPGVRADDIDVEVEDSYLRIAGRREEIDEKRQKSHYAKEIRRGSFERIVQLPARIDEEKVEAEYDNGVLRVTLPKREQAPEKRVTVKVK